MHRKPLRTYGKKPVTNRPDSSFYSLTNFLHRVYNLSDDSDDDLLDKNNRKKSINNDTLETTFDRISKDVKLPPMPPDNSDNNSILYVSSSSSSCLSDENWIQNIEEIPKVPAKKINIKRHKKKNNDKIKTNKNINLKKVQTYNRKRQSHLQDINKDETKNIEPSSPPKRKTRRAMETNKIFEINSNSDELDINKSSIVSPKLSNELKSCCVNLTRIKITDNNVDDCKNSYSSVINNENINYNGDSISINKDPSMAMINQRNDKFSDIKDCRIVLSRLDVNSTDQHKFLPTNDSKMLISSTPFFHRTISKMKPTFSPIECKHDCTSDDTIAIENSEFSEIYNNDDKYETNKIKLQDSVIDKSQIKSLISIKSTQIYSQSNVSSFEDNKTKFSADKNNKSTQLIFKSDDDVEKLTKTNFTESPDQSMNLIKSTDEIPSQTFNSSIDDIKSHLIFEETESEYNNSNNNSASIWETYENTVDNDQSSQNKIESINRMSQVKDEVIEFNKSSDSQIIISKEEIDSNYVDTSYNESTESSSEDSYHLVISNSPIKNNSSEINNSSLNTADDEDINLNNESADEIKIDKQINITNTPEPFVVLTRLNDPIKITHRRDKYANWDDQLCTIIESFEQRSSISLPEVRLSLNKIDISENNSPSKAIESTNNITTRISRRTGLFNDNNDHQMINNKTLDCDENKIVFLKPGKLWARSLSILNHINNNDDIDTLSIGKGKKWRQSVKSVRDMQSQGVLQSCIKINENDNVENAVSNEIHRNSVTRVSSSTATGNIESTSPGRVIRRVSIRVVPDVNYSRIENKNVKDTSFLEVYGIPTSKNRKTFGKRSTSIAPRDTFVYNLRYTNADITAISSGPVDAARNVVLQRCNQTDAVPFEQCYPEIFLENCRKIGEGVYGEVFLFESKREKSVIKIIPIEGEKLVNGEPQKKFSEILSEIIIAKELHNLRYHDVYRTSGFIEVKKIRCLIGIYPQKLIEHWQTFDEEKTSDNDCPSMFSHNQLYIALELGHGGQDLEAFVFQNASEAYISFVQAALTLAVAEKSLDFEHRDLHWGNILISRTNDTDITYKLDTEEITFPCKGLKVAIIDFTLSRTSYQGCCIFNDLALDEALFTAVGDYQFEIYKLMRAKIGNNWQLFEPYTNILWLHYTLDKMINGVRYKKKTTKIHKNAILKLQELKDTLLDYDSAYDFITNCDKLHNLQRKNSSC